MAGPTTTAPVILDQQEKEPEIPDWQREALKRMLIEDQGKSDDSEPWDVIKEQIRKEI